MSVLRNFAFFVALTLVSILVCSGCKSSTQQANNSQQGGNQPAAAQPSGEQSQQNSQQPAPGQPSTEQAAQPAAPPPATVVDLPKGTTLRVRLDEDLGSKISRAGDSFAATVADNVQVNGQTVISKGARADGTVIDAKPLGHFKGGALLQLRLERVHTNWGSYPVSTSSIDRAEKGKGKRTAEFGGGGAAFGALIGGLAGGGKGALIGGVAGGGAGTAGSALTGNKEIVLPAETLLTFHLEHSVHITEQQ